MSPTSSTSPLPSNSSLTNYNKFQPSTESTMIALRDSGVGSTLKRSRETDSTIDTLPKRSKSSTFEQQVDFLTNQKKRLSYAYREKIGSIQTKIRLKDHVVVNIYIWHEECVYYEICFKDRVVEIEDTTFSKMRTNQKKIGRLNYYLAFIEKNWQNILNLTLGPSSSTTSTEIPCKNIPPQTTSDDLHSSHMPQSSENPVELTENDNVQNGVAESRDSLPNANSSVPVEIQNVAVDMDLTLPVCTMLEMENSIEEFMNDPDDKLISVKLGHPIYKRHINFLLNPNLTSNPESYIAAINLYFKLVSNENGCRKVQALPAHFYTDLKKYGYNRAKDIVGNINILACDIVFIPIQMKNRWCLTIIQPQLPQIEFYDPFGQSDAEKNDVTVNIENYLQTEFRNRHGRKLECQWIKPTVSNIPTKSTLCESVLFICQYAKILLKNQNEMSLSQKDLSLIKKITCYELIKEQILH